MNFKLVYILTSSEKDIYLEQTLLSLYSARYNMPDAHIVLLTDDITAASFTGNRKNILSYAAEHISIPLDKKYSQKIRSRLLKTNMRNYVSGDFLFIDSDTLVCADLSELDTASAPVSAVYDLYCPLQDHPKKHDRLADMRKVHAEPDMTQGYFNSGILFVKDVPEAYTFFNEWHRQYLNFYTVMTQDQPALELVREKHPDLIQLLPAEYNTQIQFCIRYIRSMKIMHYFASNDTKRYDGRYACIFCNKDFFSAIKAHGTIPEHVQQMVQHPELALEENVIIFPYTEYYSTALFKYLNKFYTLKDHNGIAALFIALMQFTVKVFNKVFFFFYRKQ